MNKTGNRAALDGRVLGLRGALTGAVGDRRPVSRRIFPVGRVTDRLLIALVVKLRKEKLD